MNKRVETIAFQVPTGIPAWFKERARVANVTLSSAYRTALFLYLERYKEREDPGENQLLMDVEGTKIGMAIIESKPNPKDFGKVLEAIENLAE